MTHEKVSSSNPSSISLSADESSPTKPAPTSLKDQSLEAAKAFGRVDDQGTVWVKDGEDERAIGQFPGTVPTDPLQIYARRYLDLVAQVNLFQARLANLNGKEIDKTLVSLREQLKQPPAVGDLPKLRGRVEKLAEEAEEVKKQNSLAREEAKARALEERQELVKQAEEIAAQDPRRTQWKQSGTRLRELLDEWKRQQHANPRIERKQEDELWKRFAQARSQFDKARRQFFAELDASQNEAKRVKRKLIEEAEKLSSSTNWNEIARAYRELMNKWRKAGRASRKDDDALWQEFHAAQQRFFDARNAQNAQQEAEEQANLKAKEALLAKAEALLPVADVEQTKAQLRPLQEEWDQIGYVPRQDVARIEDRMRAVEDAVRQAEEELWKKTNPETKARANGLADQLKDLISQQEVALEAARESGDEKQIKELEEGLAARRAWLKQAQSF